MTANRNQSDSVIRSVADRLADIDRGASRRRTESRQETQKKYQQANTRTQRRYHTDRAALLEERTWTCSFCSTTHPPSVYQHPLQEGHVLIIRKERCGCQAEQQAEKQAAQEADKARRSFDCAEWVINLSRTGLVKWLATATFDEYRPRDTKEAECKRQAREYCDALLGGELGRRPWLILYGNYGTGKTHLAASILHEAMAQGMNCRFRVWPQWIEKLQGTFKGGDSSQVIRELKSGQVVVLDDLDNQHPTEWTQEKLYTALNHRYNTSKPTILTFNHTPTEMAAWLGAAVTDRMLERAYAAIKFDGASHRSGKTW